MTIHVSKRSPPQITYSRVKFWWWYAFLYFLVGYKPRWMGECRYAYKYYEDYTNANGKRYLFDKEYGIIFERKEMVK